MKGLNVIRRVETTACSAVLLNFGNVEKKEVGQDVERKATLLVRGKDGKAGEVDVSKKNADIIGYGRQKLRSDGVRGRVSVLYTKNEGLKGLDGVNEKKLRVVLKNVGDGATSESLKGADDVVAANIDVSLFVVCLFVHVIRILDIV